MKTIRRLMIALLVATMWLLPSDAARADASSPHAAPAWVALWQQAYKGELPGQFNPEQIMSVISVDRTTGDAYLAAWNMGVFKSTDGGKTFNRVDGGKIAGEACGPINACSLVISPQGGKIAVFNMWNKQGPSGYSLDNGTTWHSFTNCGRDWDYGAIDFDTKLVIGARHEDDGLHVSTDAGQTWTRLAKHRADVTGLGVIGKALLLTTQGGIERSEDNGATWNKVSDLGAFGVMVNFKGKLWALSGPAQKCLLTSSDEGKTWAQHGAALDDPIAVGPMFGADENHIVVATRRGFYESADGAKTWKLAVAPPEDTVITPQTGAAFDPIHDVFYITNWSKPVMKFARSAAPDYLATPPAEEDAKAAAAATPPLAFRRVANKGLRCFVAKSQDICGGYFYASGEDGLVYYKRDATTGELEFIQQAPELRSQGFFLCAAGGHLYGVTPHDGYHRIAWHGLAYFDIDPATGAPTRKGVVDCPASRQIIAGPGDKDLYLRTCFHDPRLLWYRIGADGKPQKAGEVAGKGIGPSTHDTITGICQMTGDGRNLYAISAKDYAIAIIARKSDGSIEYKGAVDLTPLMNNDADNYRYQWVSLGISPDGKWVYASLRNGAPAQNVYGIYKRDPATGDLTLSEKAGGLTDPLANMKGWAMAFAQDPATGYLGSWLGPMMQFKYDAASGRLSQPTALMSTLRYGSSSINVDRTKNILYLGVGEYGVIYDGLSEVKIGK